MRVIFQDTEDYERFVTLLYVCNGTKPIRISDRRDHDLYAFLQDESLDRGSPLVEVGAYALMPTHPHLVLRQLQDGGIAHFLQRVFTGYTMYFNLRLGRTGALFAGAFKSKNVSDDGYLKRLIPYVLINPAELFEPRWKDGLADLDRLEQQLRSYRFSSLPDFLGDTRAENKIVSSLDDYYDEKPTLATLLFEAHAFYTEHRPRI